MNAEARLRAAFEWTGADGSSNGHPTLRVRKVNKVTGRYVHATLRDRYQSQGAPPAWSDLAAWLLGGAGQVCESINVVGWDLFACVKTDEQIAADDNALDYDEANGRTYDCCDWGDSEEKPAAKTKPGKWELMLEEFIRGYGETTFSRLALLGDARDAFAEKGKKIRLDNLGRELKKLIGRVVEPIEGSDDELKVIGENM